MLIPIGGSSKKNTGEVHIIIMDEGVWEGVAQDDYLSLERGDDTQSPKIKRKETNLFQDCE